jgi:hypothetical protein
LYVAQLETADVFVQLPPSEVDALLVVDNSFSMAPFQARLAEGFEPLVEDFRAAGVDLHLAVVTTSVTPAFRSADNGCTAADVAASPQPLRFAGGRFLSLATPDVEASFRELVQVGVCGDGSEMGMHVAWEVLRGDEATSSGFLRPDAALSVILVSDEDDSSPLAPAWYVDAWREAKGLDDRDAVLVSTLSVVELASCRGGEAENAVVGARYAVAAAATGGVVGDICAADFRAPLQEMSRLSSRLEDTFFLSKEPATASLRVTVDDVEIGCDAGAWSYQRVLEQGQEVPAVVFDVAQRPPADSRVVVKYDPGTGDAADFCVGGEGGA